MSTSRVSLAILVAVLLSAAPAAADQCQALTADQAAWAQRLVKASKAVLSYCEPCGDKAVPAVATKATRIAVKKVGTWTELVINGAGVDLAYTFVQTGQGTYANLARLVGCPAEGVSTFVAPGQRPAGKPVEAAPPPQPLKGAGFGQKSSGKAPSCREVVDHVLEVVTVEMKGMLAGMPPESRGEAEKQLRDPAMRTQALQECESKRKTGELSDEAMRCVMRARAMAEMQACESK